MREILRFQDDISVISVSPLSHHMINLLRIKVKKKKKKAEFKNMEFGA